MSLGKVLWKMESCVNGKRPKMAQSLFPDACKSINARPQKKSSKPSIGHPKSSKKGDCVKTESKISQEAKASVRQWKSRNTKPHHVKGVSKTSQESKGSVRQQRSRRIKPHHVKGASKTSQASKAQPKNKTKGTDSVQVVSDTSQVNFENYDAIIGFMQVHSNHWKFLEIAERLCGGTPKGMMKKKILNLLPKDSVFIARKFSQTVRESLAFLEGLISSEDAILQDTTEEVPEKLEVGDSLSATTVGSSPYSRLFQGIHDDVKAIVEDENPQHEENLYYCPEVITFLLDNYMGVYPLWSGVLLGDLKRYAFDMAELPIPEHHKKRDTNCHVEQWFCIVKTSILRKKRHLRPAQLIQAMYRSLKGRYKDYIMRNNLPDDILLRHHRPSSNVSFTEDRWGRRPSKKHKKGTVKSHFYRAPFEMPTPMIQRIAPTIGNVTDVPEGVAEKVLTPTPCEVSKPKRNPAIKCIDLTNEKDISEGEVSVEVMEGYILAILNKHDKSGQLYQLNHYITGVILHGKKEEVARQGLKDYQR
ncbi:Ubiquitin-like-specific protease ESD4 [Labeo rohita]|uniref:Ubiquitin-like-specific protease ESD4 n=1 Tax=Labeo rohita TaxID=84645 RepID=A0A498MP03_LABRO|nr:Ubiquitin-like-specific protease ESD4 [Labeo rohita]